MEKERWICSAHCSLQALGGKLDKGAGNFWCMMVQDLWGLLVSCEKSMTQELKKFRHREVCLSFMNYSLGK